MVIHKLLLLNTSSGDCCVRDLISNICIFCRFIEEKMSMSTSMLPESRTQTG